MKIEILLSTCVALQFYSFTSTGLAQSAAIIHCSGGSALENAGAVTVTVTRSDNTNTVVSVDYLTKDGTGKAGADYTPVSGTLAFGAGETEKTISIPLAADDGLVDGDKTFRVCLTNATGGAFIDISEGYVTIRDNEVPANLDYSFNPVVSSQYDNERVSCVATLPDGKLVIGGWFTRVNGMERSGLACLNADGSLAAAFQTRLLYLDQPAAADQVAPLPDGRVYITGNFASVNGVERPGLARLLQDGSLDLSFAPTNLDYVSGLAIVQTDGKIIGESLRDGLVRLNLDGRRDTSFVPTILSNWNIYALAEHTDGKLLVSGGDVHGNRLIRLNTDGSVDDTFKPVFAPGADVWVQQFLVQPDQNILVAGMFYSNGVSVSGPARLNADGSLDTNFVVSGAIDPLSIVSWWNLALEASGKILGTSYRPTTARRLNSDGSLDTSFPGVQFGRYPCELSGGASAAIKSIGAVAYVYGHFFTINGTQAHSLGRILPDATLRTAMDIQPTDAVGHVCDPQVVGENDGLLTAKVRRLGQTTGPATVTWATRDGTAKAGRDYVATNGLLSFAPLEVEKIVTVPILDNATFNGRRTLQLYLTNAVDAEFIAPPLTITILDDEVGFEPGTIKRLADGSVRMIVQVSPFRTWYLEVSSDLQNWTSATSVFQNYVSPFETEFIDPDAAQFPRRFYRVRVE